MAQTDDDLRQPVITERTEGEKHAYIQGYRAALKDIEGRIRSLGISADLADSVVNTRARENGHD